MQQLFVPVTVCFFSSLFSLIFFLSIPVIPCLQSLTQCVVPLRHSEVTAAHTHTENERQRERTGGVGEGEEEERGR